MKLIYLRYYFLHYWIINIKVKLFVGFDVGDRIYGTIE